MRSAITFGAVSILQGLLIATVVIGVLLSTGAIQSATRLGPAGTLPELVLDLIIRSIFYYIVSVVTVAAVFWQKSRF